MKKLIAKEDISILNIKKGDEVEKKENYTIQTEIGEISIGFSKIEPYLTVIDDIEISESEISILEEDDDEEKTFRLQLDIKTTRKRIIEIENIIRETLKKHI